MPIDLPALAVAVAAVAFLYGSVGHGGGSGYIAVMGLFGLAPAVVRPTALLLNVLVASLATFHFARGGWFRWRLLWPFAVASIPAAAVGGAYRLTETAFRWIVAVALLVAAWRLVRTATGPPTSARRRPAAAVAVVVGLALGLLAGLTGVGGGIYLSPLLLLLGWAGARETAAVSAAFVLVNSVAGLGGFLAAGGRPPEGIGILLVVAGVGGFAGSRLGARRLPGPAIRRLLGIVLVVAAVKFLLPV